MQKDYYEILGIDRNASENDIKKAFHRLSVQWHPDKWANASDEEKKKAEDKFKEIAEAYSVLSDKDKRSKYDMFGSTDGNGPGFNMDEDLSDMFSRFAGFNPFSGFGGGFNQKRVNLNAKHTLTVGLDDLYFGREKTFKFYRTTKCHTCNGKGSTTEGGVEVCQHCHGTGMITNTQQHGNTIIQNMTMCPYCNGKGKTIKDPCHTCGGTGLEKIEDELTLKIPEGISSGMTILVPGYGNFSTDGSGKCGDLELTFVVKSSGEFIQANTYDIYTEIDVPIIDCITGGSIELEYIDGSKKKIEIPKGCLNGTKVSINGIGLPSRNGGRGNLIIGINQIMPEKISTSEMKTLKELREHKNFRN